MSCPALNDCPFFNDRMASMPAMAGMYKKKYCKSSFSSCARFQVSKQLGKAAVPADLFPNQDNKVAALIG